jgi:hypothetical protein
MQPALTRDRWHGETHAIPDHEPKERERKEGQEGIQEKQEEKIHCSPARNIGENGGKSVGTTLSVQRHITTHYTPCCPSLTAPAPYFCRRHSITHKTPRYNTMVKKEPGSFSQVVSLRYEYGHLIPSPSWRLERSGNSTLRWTVIKQCEQWLVIHTSRRHQGVASYCLAFACFVAVSMALRSLLWIYFPGPVWSWQNDDKEITSDFAPNPMDRSAPCNAH